MRHRYSLFTTLGFAAFATVFTSIGRAQAPLSPPSIRIIQISNAADGTSQAVVLPTDGEAKALRGLVAANFQVTVNGREVKPLSVAPAEIGQPPLSVVLAIDVSGSMQGAGIQGAIKGASAFVDHLAKRDFCALEVFGTGVRQIADFTDDHDLIKKALAKLSATDRRTYLREAIFESLDRADKAPTSRSAVVLLTDGKDEGSPLGTQEVFAKITSHEVPIYALAYGMQADTETLKRFAAASHGQFYLAPGGSDISGAYQTIAEDLQNDYQLTWKMLGGSTPSAQVTVSLQYQGMVVSTSQTIFTEVANPVKGSSLPSTRPRWWMWLVGLGLATLVGGLLTYRKYLRRSSPELALTMVPPRVWLEVIKGADMGQKLIVFDKEAIIGRDSRTAQIVLKNDPLIGRRHARLRQNEQGQYVIDDLESQNGVSINGVKISEPVTLQSDDRIVMGLTELVYTDKR